MITVIAPKTEFKIVEKRRNYPVVPTEFLEDFIVGNWHFKAGWYAVKIDENGLEGLNGLETRFDTFEKCTLACTLHNKIAMKMTEDEITLLYVQRRFM